MLSYGGPTEHAALHAARHADRAVAAPSNILTTATGARPGRRIKRECGAKIGTRNHIRRESRTENWGGRGSVDSAGISGRVSIEVRNLCQIEWHYVRRRGAILQSRKESIEAERLESAAPGRE